MATLFMTFSSAQADGLTWSGDIHSFPVHVSLLAYQPEHFLTLIRIGSPKSPAHFSNPLKQKSLLTC